jgi:hypothetical protein
VGFVGGLLGAPLHQFVPVVALGILLVAIRFPTRGRLLGPFQRRYGAGFGAD